MHLISFKYFPSAFFAFCCRNHTQEAMLSVLVPFLLCIPYNTFSHNVQALLAREHFNDFVAHCCFSNFLTIFPQFRFSLWHSSEAPVLPVPFVLLCFLPVAPSSVLSTTCCVTNFSLFCNLTVHVTGLCGDVRYSLTTTRV